MKEEILKMVDQECPQCKSSGDVISYMPIIEDKNIVIELECENCGHSEKIEADWKSDGKVDSAEQEEQIYMQGESYSYKNIIRKCQAELRGLGIDLKTKEEFSEERIETIQILRRLCLEHGDNDWDDDLHLADIIDKHLRRYLDK